MTIISFGMRCNTAIILRWRLEKQTYSLPFDWVQMALETQLAVLDLYKTQNEIENFYWNLFSNDFDYAEKRCAAGWFPHDEFDNHELEHTIDKYIRRTYRLMDILSLPGKKIFLTLFQWGGVDPEQIKNTLQCLDSLEIDYLWISINGNSSDETIEKHININVPFAESYEAWEDNIIMKLKKIAFF